MSTYKFQVTSGSATATTDLADIGAGVRNDAVAQLNPTNLAYGFYSVDASGRVFISGTVGVTGAAVTANVTQGTTPWIVSGNVSATQVGVWGVTASAVTATITGVLPGVGTTNLGKRENDPFIGSSVGVFALGVDNTTNNYAPIPVDSSRVVTRDDATETHDAAPVGTGVSVMSGQFDDVAVDVVDENDMGRLRISTNRNLFTTLRDAAGNERGLNIDANNEIGIGAIRTSVTPGTGAAHLGKAEDQLHVSGDVGVMALGVVNAGITSLSSEGDYCPIAVDPAGGLLFSASSPAINVVNASDFAEDAGHISGSTGTFVLGNRNDSGATNKTGANNDYSPICTDIRGRLWSVPTFETRSDTFVATGNGTTVTVATFPVKYFTISVAQTGTVTSWDVRLEVSLDNTTFTTVITHTNVTGTGVSLNYISPWPTLYFRARCAGLVLGAGTNVIATILGMN